MFPSCTELLLLLIQPRGSAGRAPSRQCTCVEGSAEGCSELQRARVPSAPLKCVPLQGTRLRSAAPGAPAGSGWGCTVRPAAAAAPGFGAPKQVNDVPPQPEDLMQSLGCTSLVFSPKKTKLLLPSEPLTLSLLSILQDECSSAASLCQAPAERSRSRLCAFPRQ